MSQSSLPLYAGFLSAAVLATAASSAQANQAWVSGHGSDASGCGSTTSPCRSFQYAHDNIITPGGEIDVLDPADYGPVTIAKAISIVNDGVGTATIVQSAQRMNAITVAAGATDSVHLRGLSLDGLGVAANGVSLSSAGQIDIVNCVVRRFMSHGIDLEPSTALNFTMTNVIAMEDANAGINLRPAGNMVGAINGLTASYSVNGLQLMGDISPASANIFVSVVRSVANSNGNGFAAFSASGHGYAKMALIDSTASGNGSGIYAGPNGQISVAHSSMVGNGSGADVTPSASISTMGDNNIYFNGTLMAGGGGSIGSYPPR
jgi:hypothetical protein